MSEGKAAGSDGKATGDDRLPEPDGAKLPLSPDEIERHKVLPGWEGHYTAPHAGSTADPLSRPQLLPDPPGLQPPPSGGRSVDLNIAPGVLKKAAGQIDDIYNHFYKPAASLGGARAGGPGVGAGGPARPPAVRAAGRYGHGLARAHR
ncbi:hypothetical protein ACLQ2E_16800 [Streptomyces lavendulocolor]